MVTEALISDDDPTPQVTPHFVRWTEKDLKLLVEVFSVEQPINALGKAFNVHADHQRSYAALVRQLSKLPESEKMGVSKRMVSKAIKHAHDLHLLFERGEVDIEIKGVRYINSAKAYRILGITAQQLSNEQRGAATIHRIRDVGYRNRWLYNYDDIVAFASRIKEFHKTFNMEPEVEPSISPETPKKVEFNEVKVEPEPEQEEKSKKKRESKSTKDRKTVRKSKVRAKKRIMEAQEPTYQPWRLTPVDPAREETKEFEQEQIRNKLKNAAKLALDTGLLSPDEVIDRLIQKLAEKT